MKTTIYYFSGTGNSLKIARDLSEKLEECELVPIAKVWQMDYIVSTSEKVGFIFPLYFYGLPKIVYDFVNKIQLDTTNYLFAIITKGGDIDGVAFQQLERILGARSKTLSAMFSIKMPPNLYVIYSEEMQKELLQKSIIKIEKVAEIIKKNGKNLKKEINKKEESQLEKRNKHFQKNVNANDKFFYVDENCNQCGICEKICPVNNLIIVEGVPQWQHECQQCVACINFCPEKSIQYGKITLEMQRYHHPEITVQDMITQKN
ncbi:MAG: EFR1 family ferrodoxin [Promethearchaeota archaeon]